jgi:short-subunit dehydrogenase
VNRQTVVITGASAGVGRATAIEFARHGWNVGLIARDGSRLEATRAEVVFAGGQALVLPLDVADAVAVFDAANRVITRWGGIDVWINCAMVTVFAAAQDVQPTEYRRVIDVTLLGCIYGTLAAMKHMKERDAGTIVQVGSALAYRAIPLQSAYCAAKHGMRGFTDALRSELIASGSRIRLSMVQLPGMNTPQFTWGRNHLPRRPQPVPPVFQPETAARALYRAALEAPRELWVGRPTLQIILGNILAPGLLDRILARIATRGQMTDEPASPNAPDNLFEPVPGEFGAHGRFEAHARERAVTFNPARLRAALGTGAAALAVVGILARLRRLRYSQSARMR